MFVFLVAPYSLDPHFKEKSLILSELAREAGVKIGWASPEYVRASAGGLVGLGDLKQADVVIGDLSFERPSCYFEVGLANGLNKPVFLIAKQGTSLHQVAGRDAVEFYSTIEQYKQVVQRILSRAICSQRLA